VRQQAAVDPSSPAVTDILFTSKDAIFYLPAKKGYGIPAQKYGQFMY
jgi:hypothetical protein